MVLIILSTLILRPKGVFTSANFTAFSRVMPCQYVLCQAEAYDGKYHRNTVGTSAKCLLHSSLRHALPLRADFHGLKSAA